MLYGFQRMKKSGSHGKSKSEKAVEHRLREKIICSLFLSKSGVSIAYKATSTNFFGFVWACLGPPGDLIQLVTAVIYWGVVCYLLGYSFCLAWNN